MAYDREAEYAKPDDIEHPILSRLKPGEITELDGLVYGRTPKYLQRLPTELFKARGYRFRVPTGYWDASNFSSDHQRIFNSKLSEFTVSPDKPQGEKE